jgi:predicted membrane metal-binding protein
MTPGRPSLASILDLAVRTLVAVGLVLIIGGLMFGMDAVALTGVGFWIAATAVMLGHAGPRRRRGRSPPQR